MESSPQLFPDITLVYQLAIFFCCYFVMRGLVFKPYLDLLRLRKEKTSGLKEKAAAEQARATELRNQYETSMAAVKKKIAVWTVGRILLLICALGGTFLGSRSSPRQRHCAKGWPNGQSKLSCRGRKSAKQRAPDPSDRPSPFGDARDGIESRSVCGQPSGV